jgi:hypothetical protein
MGAVLRAAVLVMVGCGRIGFDPLAAGGDDVVTGDGRLGDGNGTNGSDGAMVTGPTFDQINVFETTGSNVTAQVTLPNPLAIGDVIVVAVGWRSNAGTISALTDNRGNIYTAVCNLVRGGGSGGTSTQELFASRVTVAGASTTLTVTTTVTSPGLTIRAASYTGVAPSGSFDCLTGSGGNSNLAQAGGAVTTIGSMIAGANTADVPSGAANSGLTVRRVSPLFGDVWVDKLATTTGLQIVNVQLSGAGNWVMQAAALPPP